MNVEARSQKIENVFKKGVFIIPDYQREYDWGDDEVNEFLEDIEETIQGESYFIGHMVLEGEFNGNKFNVIDGQQRITTITILLSVIRDLFFEKKEDNLAQGINENYIFGKDRSNKEYIILENKMPYPVLQYYVQSIPEKKDKTIKPIKKGEKQIIKVYNNVYKLFENKTVPELEILRDKILDLEIIFVAVSDEVDAFTIFETLNATGKDLTPLDLIKNQIFKLYPRQPHIEEPSDSWKVILSNSENKNLKFLNNFWSSRYKKVSNKKIYKQFVNNIVKKRVDIKEFLHNLKGDSNLFYKMNFPKKEDWTEPNESKVYYSLNAIIRIFGVEVSNSILLGLLREYENKNISLKYLTKALNIIEKYHFINNAICSNRSSGLDTMYARFSREILNAKDKHSKHSEIDLMISKLKEKIPSKEEFDANFNEKVYFSKKHTKQKNLVQYILNKQEISINKNIHIVDISLEHIYPESPNDEWQEISDKNLIKNIGNIVLLDRDLNSKIGNKSFENKKKIILANSNLNTTKQVFKENSSWTSSRIVERRKKIVDLMYNDIWNA